MNFPYEEPVNPESVGIDADKLGRVVARFKQQQAQGVFPGGQFVLRRHGKLVVNEVCGLGRGWRPDEALPELVVQPDTPFPVLSAGKPLAGIAVALLEERGVLDVHMPVAALLPEFGAHGKDAITILDVLTHRTGIQMPDLVQNYHLWGDRDAVLHALAAAKPVYQRGAIAYAAYEYGWILSEIFWRAVGCTLAEFVAAEISAPLGLPALQYGLAGRALDELAFSYWLGKERMMVSGINVAVDFEARNNSIEQINSLNPAVSMVADAASLAAFYEFLLHGGVTRQGGRLLSDAVIQKYIQRNAVGLDRSSKFYTSLGRGFMLGTGWMPSLYGYWKTQSCFGHAGGFSSLAFGDAENNIAAAFVTNGNRDFIDLARRYIPLAHGLRQACRTKN